MKGNYKYSLRRERSGYGAITDRTDKLRFLSYTLGSQIPIIRYYVNFAGYGFSGSVESLSVHTMD